MTDAVDPEDAERFCAALHSIDDLIDDINKDGPVVVEVPADMGRVIARLGKKFVEVGEAAPTPKLKEAMNRAADTFNRSAETLLADPPVVSVDRANEIFDETMEGIQEGGADVRAFRAEHCGGDDAEAA